MSENKEKLQNDEVNEPETDVSSSDSVHDEMEELARIFREELGKAVQESEESDETDLNDIEVEGYDPRAVSTEGVTAYKETMCECCGERPAGTDEDPDSPFCNECAALMEKYPYDWKGIVAFVVVLGIALMSLVLFAGYTPIFSKLSEGNKAKAEGKLYSAEGYYDDLRDYLSDENYNLNLRNFKRDYTELEYQLGNLADALDFINTNYDINDISDKDVKAIYDDIVSMQMTTAAIQTHLSKYPDITEDNYDDIIKEFESLLNQKIYFTKDEDTYDESSVKNGDYEPDGSEKVYIYDEGWVRLYQYSAAAALENKDDTIKYLKLAYDKSSYMKTYVSTLLGQTYIGNGKYDEAEKLAKEISASNKESINTYLLNAMLFRYRDKNYKTAVDTCINGLNSLAKVKDRSGSDLIASTGDSLSMQKTLSYIMLKDYDKAYESAKECYSYQTENYALTIQARDMYAILAYATDDMDTYNGLVDEIKSYEEEGTDYSFEADVEDYINGKITLQEIASSGRYDLI